MPALAAPKAKRAANNAPPNGAGSKALRKRSRRPNGAESLAVGALQPKLRVNDPNDAFEREADRIADRVMSMPEPEAERGEREGRDPEEGERKPPLQRQEAEEEEQAQTFSLQRQEDEEPEEDLAQTFALQRQEEPEQEDLAQAASLQRQAQEEPETPPMQRQETEEEDQQQTTSMQRQEMEEEEEPEMTSMQRQGMEEKPEEQEVQTFSLQRQAEEEEEQTQTSSLQRRTEEEEEDTMQQRAKRPRRPRITPQFETGLRLMRRGGGQPLPDPLRAFLEPRFRRGFADVRVHAGPDAAELARDANARAFTVGKHIVFGAGEYRPGAEQGRRLIAHELTHVLQQRGGLHSVQREVAPDRAAVANPQADLPTLEELRSAFKLDSNATPPSVRSVAVAMLRNALLSPSNAQRLRPLTRGESETAALVRAIQSGAYTLELATLRGGRETGWKLTHRAKRQTFVSRSNSATQQWPGGAAPGRDTITLPAPPAAEDYAEGTLAARLESIRRGGQGTAERPAPLLPVNIPAGSVPDKAPAVAAPAPEAENVPARPAAEPAAEAAEVPAEPLRLAQPREVAGEAAAPPAVSEPSEQEGGEPAAEPEHAPLDPQEDPEFQQTLGQIGRTRKAQGDHRPPKTKLEEETKPAAVLPEDQQRDTNERKEHLKEISNVAEKSKQVHFTPEDFKVLLAQSLTNIQLPANEDDAKRFKREKPLEAVKKNISGQVKDQNQKIAGPLAQQVATAEPPASGLPLQKPAELEEEGAGKKPRPISSAAAAPKPRLDSEISMEKESASLDELMTEHDLTEEQLAQSNEPTFVQALDTKREAQRQAAAAPGRFREQEQPILANSQAKARHAGAAKFGGMFKTREGAFGDVFGKQKSTVSADKAKQEEVLTELKTIYEGTKTDVDNILDGLSSTVDFMFSFEVDLAKRLFEARVESQLDEIYGFFKFDDWLFGADTEAIEGVFQREKELFLKTMGGLLDRMAVLIAAQLNAAIKRIERGRSEKDALYVRLSTDQRKLSQDAFDLFDTQFDTLEDSVRDKQQDLADTLAESYKTNVDSLRESFDKIKADVSKGWIQGAVDFVVSVAKTIKKLAELLWSILSRIGNIIGDILAHPIRFIENLAEGVGNGFDMFIERIDDYLVAGFFDWLRGTVGGPGIVIPDKFDAAGIFSLVAQVVGLTYDTFRKIASKVWGKAAVEFLEKGAAVAEKGLEFFSIVREKGLGGLWEHIKDALGSMVDDLMTKVKETVLYEVIKKALAFIATLFNPVGAFIKAAQAIYAGIRFLMDNIDRIAEIVDAFLDSLELAVAGKTDAISQKIVAALRGVIVVAIDFLAKLLRLGNLDDKVRKILKAIRTPVERGMEAVLKRLRPLVRKVMRALGVGKEEVDGEKVDGEKEGGRPLGREEVVTQVVGLMKQPTKATTPAAALAEKKEQAQSLIKKYQPMLKKGQLRIVISDPTAAEVEKDAAVDFDVSASPGTKGEAPVPIAAEDGKRPTVDVPFALAGRAHQVTIVPRAGDVVVLMSSEKKLPLHDHFKQAHIAINQFKHYMSTVTDPVVLADYNKNILPKIDTLQVPDANAFAAIYNDLFPKSTPAGPGKPRISEEEAKARVKVLVTRAQGLLSGLKAWGAATGISDLSKEAVADTLRIKGDAVWRQGWTKTKEDIKNTIKGFDYKGKPIEFTGSAFTGWKGPHKGQIHFDAADFDVDMYVVHAADFLTAEAAAKAARRPVIAGKIFASAATPVLLTLQGRVRAALRSTFPTVRRIGDSTIVLREE